MITPDQFRELALSFPATVEAPHFDRAAFKAINKRIFATLHEESGVANLKLPPSDQAMYCSYDKNSVYPVPNKWGLKGWTTFLLTNLPEELLKDALQTAYTEAKK